MGMCLWQVLILAAICLITEVFAKHITAEEVIHYRGKIKSMFDSAYDNYLRYAENYDELMPITCQGMETWGNFSLTLIDSMDSLILFKNYTEFHRVANYVVHNIDFDQNINVSVFETNIRVVGGLLSAHLLSYKSGIELEPGWPCNGPLLRLAEKVARKLLPAFQTKTGMPYGTVNLRYGVPLEETPITCTAGVATFIVEFGTLSRLTGDPIFENTALKAIQALHQSRSKLDLVGNHINTSDGKWTAIESSIGAGVDSYFEYLIKGALLLQLPELMDMFNVYYAAINKYMKRDDWYFVVHMNSGLTTMPVFQSLESFFPGLLTLIGEVGPAKKSLLNYHYVLRQYGFIPEFFDVSNNEVKRNGNPLRPEFSESLFYLYRATRDPFIRSIGAEIVETIEYSAKTNCGYATVKNVVDHTIEDRMESFFLAETLKYLYLLFDNENFIYNEGSQGVLIQTDAGECVIDAGGYIFNTEAHPIDISILDCCSTRSKYLSSVKDGIDFYAMLGLGDDREATKQLKHKEYMKPVGDEDMPIIIEPSIQNEGPVDIITDHSYPKLKEISIEPIEDSPLPTVPESVPKEKVDLEHQALSESIISTSSSDHDSLTFSISKTSENPWTPIHPSKTQLPTSTHSSVNQEACDRETQTICTKPSSTEMYANPSKPDDFLANIPSKLNLSDFILQYEDDRESSVKNIKPIRLQASHELLLCQPSPFLMSFAKYGQVLVKSEL